MDITTSSLFSEPESYFSINYNVNLVIRKYLNNLIANKLIQERNGGKKQLNLIVSTNKETESVIVKGPDITKDFVNWGLWLPYREIAQATNQVEPYLYYYFEAVIGVFEHYKIPEKDLRKVQEAVEKEIIGNPEYYNHEEQIPDLDLSDYDL